MSTSTTGVSRSPARERVGASYEFYSWVFMRVSGIILVALVLAHLAIMHLVDGGVARVNFAFVAGRWANPFWQTYDWALLMLATVHGANGVRVVVEDYVRDDVKRTYTKFLLYTVTFFMIALGTFVIVAFNPNARGPLS
ncbi:MAG: succinate dehydrogenase hydrophobic membrane anchor subunit [Actinomycetota bacterium]|nr:succinate dehydrogenase hydrophobic membrane anchor subunit [Actinomycetota bacterium]